MPVWTVQTDSGDERVEAGLLATEGGALVALSEDGVMTRAWAPGHWRTARHVAGADAPSGDANRRDPVVAGLPRV